MISVIIPAHDEELVIARGLEAIVNASDGDELELIVVCNGCQDETARRARAVGAPVRVIETEVASKVHALNLGDSAARGFPRIYMDADVEMSAQSVRDLASALTDGRWLAAAPRVETLFLPQTDWSVRAYYRFWMALPFVQEGMMAAGVYAVSERGRERWDVLPEVIADDGYFRLLFGPQERIEVQSAVSKVRAPAAFADLIRIKTRSRLGVAQLRERFPDMFARERRTKRYGRAFWAILRQPSLYPCALPFLVVSFISRVRAGAQRRLTTDYRWERDHSSRAGSAAGQANAPGN